MNKIILIVLALMLIAPVCFADEAFQFEWGESSNIRTNREARDIVNEKRKVYPFYGAGDWNIMNKWEFVGLCTDIYKDTSAKYTELDITNSFLYNMKEMEKHVFKLYTLLEQSGYIPNANLNEMYHSRPQHGSTQIRLGEFYTCPSSCDKKAFRRKIERSNRQEISKFRKLTNFAIKLKKQGTAIFGSRKFSERISSGRDDVFDLDPKILREFFLKSRKSFIDESLNALNNLCPKQKGVTVPEIFRFDLEKWDENDVIWY